MKRSVAMGTALLVASCGGAYLTAPPGSTMEIVANPDFIPSHGGVSELMAIVTEPAGTDVPDGTVVLWTTNLGHVDRETRTVRGIARNRLVSDARSGTALVTASSGADALPPTTSAPSTTTPGSTTTTTTTTTFVRPASASDSAASALLGAAQNSATVEVDIGNALVRSIRLRADPPRVGASNSTRVIATVLDQFGNPVANVPVFFEVIVNLDTDFFEGGGGAVFTDNNGEASAILRTRRTLTGTITVQATAAGPSGFIVSPPLAIAVV